ncbi:hypothetical protein GCM10022209_42780 [Chitinophaga oryziterrae]
MVQEDYLRIINGTLLLTGKKSEDEFLRANWKRLFAIFDTGPMYNVVDGKKVVGTLDSGFARERQLPFVFVLGGQEWNALKIDHELQQIVVQKNETGIPPKWSTIGNFDVPFELAQEIGHLLMSDEKLEFLDLPALRILNAERNAHSNLGWNHGSWIIEASSDAERIYLWTFSGDKINRSLYKFLCSKVKGDIKYDYKKVIIDFGKEPKSVQEIYDLITELRTRTEQEIRSHMEIEIEVKWFSKFSECLPAKLSKKAIIEKDMDLSGLVRELNEMTIDY